MGKDNRKFRRERERSFAKSLSDVQPLIDRVEATWQKGHTCLSKNQGGIAVSAAIVRDDVQVAVKLPSGVLMTAVAYGTHSPLPAIMHMLVEAFEHISPYDSIALVGYARRLAELEGETELVSWIDEDFGSVLEKVKTSFSYPG